MAGRAASTRSTTPFGDSASMPGSAHSLGSVRDVLEGEEEETRQEEKESFYRMIPEMHGLVMLLDSKRKKDSSELGKTLSRGGFSALTGKDVVAAQRRRMSRHVINAGCGFESPVNKPYKAFENGVSFEESTRTCETSLREILSRRKTAAQMQQEHKQITPVALDQLIRSRAAQYQRQLFVLSLEDYPRAQVRNKAIEVRVAPLIGDPDLYVSIAEPPTEREYMWRSLQEGQDVIHVHPDDPNYIFGSYYICVVCTSSECEFELTVRVLKPMLHDDEEAFVKAQRVMYLSIKSCIKSSDHRRRLCAGGRGLQQMRASMRAAPDVLDTHSEEDQEDSMFSSPASRGTRDASSSRARSSARMDRLGMEGDSERLSGAGSSMGLSFDPMTPPSFSVKPRSGSQGVSFLDSVHNTPPLSGAQQRSRSVEPSIATFSEKLPQIVPSGRV